MNNVPDQVLINVLFLENRTPNCPSDRGWSEKNAKSVNNAVTELIWDVKLTDVAPSYLSLLLGIVKKHYDLLEKVCHNLDVQIARVLGKEHTFDSAVMTTQFHNYVTSCQIIKRKKEEKEKLEKKGTVPWCGPWWSSRTKATGIWHHWLAGGRNIQAARRLRWCIIQLWTCHRHLDSILQAHWIVTQAFHSHSYIGNHCNKYLEKNVYTTICNSVIRKTFEYTDNNNMHDLALQTKNKNKKKTCDQYEWSSCIKRAERQQKEQCPHIVSV